MENQKYMGMGLIDNQKYMGLGLIKKYILFLLKEGNGL